MATSEVQTVSATADKARLAAAVALLVAGLVAYYMLAKQGAWVQWAGLLVGVVAAVAVFLTSESGHQLVAFGRDAVREVRKLTESLNVIATKLERDPAGFVFSGKQGYTPK